MTHASTTRHVVAAVTVMVLIAASSACDSTDGHQATSTAFSPSATSVSGPELYGPWRLHPAGTPPGDPTPRATREPPAQAVIDEAALRTSRLFIPPPPTFRITQISGTSVGSTLIQVVEQWAGGSDSLTVAHNAFPKSMLPADVYLYPSTSPIVIEKITVAGHPALIERPASGPAPGVGVVRVAVGANELALTSPTMDHGELTKVAEQLLSDGSVNEVPQ